MIIALGGRAGTGKSTVAEFIAKKLKFKHYSNGDLMRELAEKRGISLLELSKIAETTREIDELLDKRQKELGESQDNFVIDSRLGFHFIPKARKVFLDCDLQIRAKRILNDKSRKEKNEDMKDAIENIMARENSEISRYKKYYGIDPYKPENYEFVIDTTALTVKQTSERVIEFVKQKI